VAYAVQQVKRQAVSPVPELRRCCFHRHLAPSNNAPCPSRVPLGQQMRATDLTREDLINNACNPPPQISLG
jgi:hypothetical protein